MVRRAWRYARRQRKTRKLLATDNKEIEDDYLFGPLAVESYVIFYAAAD